MEGIVLRVRLITGHSMDVRYDEPDAVSEDEVVDHVVSTLAEAQYFAGHGRRKRGPA